VARRCVFCGVEGKLTKEHVVPRWFTDLLDIPKTFKFVHEHQDDGAERRVRTGSSIDIQAKAVCGRCNSGWMSDLERAAMPLLIPMLSGEATTLDRPAMDTIAFWVTKTAVMSGLASPLQRPALHPRVMQLMYQRRVPPPQTGVWLGLYLGSFGSMTAARLMTRMLVARHSVTGQLAPIYDWTAAFGHLLIKVVMPSPPLWTLRYDAQLGEPKPLTPIHSDGVNVESCNWPPLPGYVESDLLVLSFGLAGKNMRIHMPPA
jgi:hypothetical protein